MDESREGDARMLQMTERGIDICDPDADDRARNSARRNAAIDPTIFATMWDRWGAELPPESEIRRYLTREHDFNPKHVARVASNYLTTLGYATLVGNGAVADPEVDGNGSESEVDTPNNGNGSEAPAKQVQVGSFVQWTSQGVYQFPEPLAVTRIEEQDGKRYAYFEAMKGYAPMSELTLAEPSQQINLLAPAAASPAPPEPPSGGPEVRFPLTGGTNEVIIRLKKPASKKEFDQITKLLALSEDSLVENPED